MDWLYLHCNWNLCFSSGLNLSKPIFILTSDQDWAPTWAVSSFLETTGDIPVHIFRTNPCPLLDLAFKSGKITQGWHPNLLHNSSHGDTQEKVIKYMVKHFPNCNTARNHTYFTNTHFDRLLFKSGVRADSQIATYHQEDLFPLKDISGIVRFPVFFEDDVFFDHEAPNLLTEGLLKNLFSPGLKIFNLHATFIACNTPSAQHYQKFKSKIFASKTESHEFIYKGKGVKTVFLEIKNIIKDKGYKFQCFQTFVNNWIEENIKS